MSKLWQPGPLWSGETVAILATGSGMTHELADEARHCHRRIAINSSWQLAPDADMLVAHDLAWWQAHPRALEFAGRKVCGQAGALDVLQFDAPEETVELGPMNRVRLRNSGLLAIRIAAAAGAARIVPFAMDLGADHWHGEAEPLRPIGQLRAIARAFEQLAAELAARGVEVVRERVEAAA